MNRENRRHPTHPLLPPLTSSKTRITDKSEGKTSTKPKSEHRKKRNKV